MIRLQTLFTSIFLIVTLGSSKKLVPDEEIPLESGVDIDDMGDLADLEVDDADELSLDRGATRQPSPSIHFQTGKNDLFCYGKPK